MCPRTIPSMVGLKYANMLFIKFILNYPCNVKLFIFASSTSCPVFRLVITLSCATNVLFINEDSLFIVDSNLSCIVFNPSIITVFATSLILFASSMNSWKSFFRKDKLYVSLIQSFLLSPIVTLSLFVVAPAPCDFVYFSHPPPFDIRSYVKQ